MKISAVPASSTHPNNNNESNVHVNASAKNHKFHKKQPIGHHKQKRHENDSSSESCCSECSDSGSGSSSATNNRATKKLQNKPSKMKPTSTSSDSDSSDVDSDHSDDGSRFSKINLTLGRSNITNDANSKPSNKINQITDGGDGASSSDMELPALVSAAIQRVESFSDGENSKTDPIPQYTSTLLRDFMEKTQMMGSTFTAASSPNEKKENRQFDGNSTNSRWQNCSKNIKTESPLLSDQVPQKRKRGRPKKQMPLVVNVGLATSESPDSGITSTPHSPVLPIGENGCKTSHNQRNKSQTKKPESTSTTSLPKLNISSLEKSIYATERVLYPPRRKKRDVSCSSTKPTLSEDLLDPVWRKIDINKKFRRPSVSGYKSDGGCSTVCSKVLVARCNNVSGDYGSVSQRSLSGYKSDYSCKSKRSGYKSDYSVKAKSCGYRTDSGMKNRKRVRKKRRLKSLCSKSPVNDLDILQLAGLSLGQSEESSRDSLNRSTTNLLSKSNFRKKSKNSTLDRNTMANTSKDILSSLCERVTQRLSGLDENPPSVSSINSHKLGSSSVKSSGSKPGMITCRRMSTVSHCSSRSGGSRIRRKHRKRFKSRSRSENADTKLSMQIEMLTNSFTTLCQINDKANKTDNSKSKRTVKKRKQSVNSDAANTSTTISKRRHKKVAQTQSPDDHKLPLKKRLYLLTPGEKLDAKLSSGDSEGFPSTSTAHKSNANTHAKITTKAITPKKRHLLENQQNATVLSPKSINSPKQIDCISMDSTVPVPASVPQKTHHQSRKRNKTESIGSKNQLSTDSTKSQNLSARPSVIRSSSTTLPPPGVFESTIDLEVQIPTIPNIITKTEIDSPRTFGEAITKIVKDEPNSKSDRLVESLLNKTGGHLLLRKKRKKANRTGFPTVRKKKKKLDDWSATEIKPTTIPIETDSIETTQHNPTNQNLTIDDCDRVPMSGETAATFIERNSRPRLSVVSLERLQGKILNEEDIGAADSVSDTKQSVYDSNASTVVVKSRRSDVIGRVKQHLKKNIREPRDLSSDNEPLINLVSAKAIASNGSKLMQKRNTTKPSTSTEALSIANRSRSRAIGLDRLGEDQIKEIERTSKLAIVKLEVLKSDKTSVSRPRAGQLKNLSETTVKKADKLKAVEKTKGSKIITAKETLLSSGEPLVDNNSDVTKMTRRLTRDVSSMRTEPTKRTRQNASTLYFLKDGETSKIEEKSIDGKTIRVGESAKVGEKLKISEKSKITNSAIRADKSNGDDEKKIVHSKLSNNNSKVTKNSKVGAKTDDISKVNKVPDVRESSKVNDLKLKNFGKSIKSQSIGNNELLDSMSKLSKTEPDQSNATHKSESTKKHLISKHKSILPKTINKKATTKIIDGEKSNVACEEIDTNEKNENPANFDMEELLVDVTTKISKTSGMTRTAISNDKSKRVNSSASKKLMPIESRKSVDSKSNYQSEFEKSLSDVMLKKVVSKENVGHSTAAARQSENLKLTDSIELKTASKPTKGRKRKLSASLPKDKDSDCETINGDTVKKQKTGYSDDKVKEHDNVASVSRKIGIKKRNAKIIDKPLIELQSQIIDSTNQNKFVVLKADTFEPVAKLRNVIQHVQPDLMDDGDMCKHIDAVRPFDPLIDLEHDPLPPEECQKIVEPLSDSDSSKKVAKPKKKYLTAGLFSDYFKRSSKASDKTSARVKETVSEDRRVTLPIPPYCEKYFRRTIQDFELPYDLWYAHQNEKLPG